MRLRLLCCATMMSSALATMAGAQTLLYSFEGGVDGFAPNGAAAPTSSTIGATHGDGSLAITLPGDGFVGVLTSVVPGALLPPPAVESILFDLTIEEAYTGGFADVGVSIFAADFTVDPPVFGFQAQFSDFVSLGGRAPGTYTDLQIDLDNDAFTGNSYAELYGPGSNLTPTGFQFYISEGGGGNPFTFYIDNVRAVPVPEPGTALLLASGALGLALLGRRRRMR